jgi:hypothetical protein
MERGAGLGGGEEGGAVGGLDRAQERPGAEERRQRGDGQGAHQVPKGTLNETGMGLSMR